MKPKTKSSPLTKLAIFTTITSLVWVGFDIYRASTRIPAPQIPPSLLSPLDPEINTQALDSLKNRTLPTSPSLLSPLTPLPSPSASPSPTTSPPTPTPTLNQ